MKYVEKEIGNRSYTASLETNKRHLLDYNRILGLNAIYNVIAGRAMTGDKPTQENIDAMAYWGFRYKGDGSDLNMLRSRILSLRTRYELKKSRDNQSQPEGGTYEESLTDISRILQLGYQIPAYEISLTQYCNYVKMANKAAARIKEINEKHGRRA